MILHDDGPQRKMLAPDFTNIPAELAALNAWACWRARTRAYKGGQRVVHVPVHPFNKHQPRNNHPEEWASFEAVLHPRLRKPVDGIGVYLGQDSGLAVVLNADPGLPARLGDQVVYAERSVSGDGLTVVVRDTVMDAVVDRFVPLAGHGPYQANASVEHAGCQDTGRTLAGHAPYQEIALAEHGPYQEIGSCQDTGRTLVSWSPEDNHAGGGNKTVAEQLAELGRQVAVEKRTIHKAVYSLISLLKANHVLVEGVTPPLLREFAETAGFDLAEVYRKVVLLWGKWKHHEVLLEDALRAVKADPSLLEGLLDLVVDEQTLLVAGMARFLGAEGQPFALDQRILARVVGLSGQQAASDLVALLLKEPLLEVVERARYTAKRSTVYRWVGPGAVKPQPEVEVTATPSPPRRTKVPTPTPQVAAAPPPPDQDQDSSPGLLGRPRRGPPLPDSRQRWRVRRAGSSPGGGRSGSEVRAGRPSGRLLAGRQVPRRVRASGEGRPDARGRVQPEGGFQGHPQPGGQAHLLVRTLVV